MLHEGVGVYVDYQGRGGPFLFGGELAEVAEEFVEAGAVGSFQEHLVAELLFEFGNGGFGGAQDFDAFRGRGEETGGFGREAQGFLLLGCAEEDVGEGGEGRVAHEGTELDLLFVEAGVVLSRGESDGVVFGVKGLDENAAGDGSPPCPAGGLREELEAAFGGAEIGHGEADVGVDDSDEGDVGDVVAFGDHLGAGENVEFTGAHGVEEALIVAAAGDGVAVHAADAGLRKGVVEFVFEAFRACAEEVEMFAGAVGAGFGDALGVAAIVAEEAFIAAMPGEGDGAVGAEDGLAAGAAVDKTGEAAAVHENHGLFACGEAFAEGFEEGTGE